ncbi:MAG TPA: hypothetical protein PK624_12960 [Spirochaetota bacterium]|nr:hypothetical protein [Spirochaetota bacterium]HOR45696.1 hypothetical protein [Spirochaetota bacterium]HPK57324.1 hypothetical protein [Spirochaetota bacterium]
MKKPLILLMLIFSAFTLFSEEEYDFRKARWGMSFEEVLNSEEVEPLYSVKNEHITYRDSIFFKYYSFNYSFSDGKLSSIFVSFDDLFPLEKNNYFEEYNEIKKLYEKRYGKVSKSQTIWYNKKFKNSPDRINEAISKKHVNIGDAWILEKTVISLGIVVNDSGKVSIVVLYKEKIEGTMTEKDYLSEKI